MKCRCCESEELFLFLDLGNHPPSDQFRKAEQLNDPVVFLPLQVYMCEKCGLPQLGYIVDPIVLYQDNYPYEASVTKTGHIHFNEFAESVVKSFKLEKNDLCIDIGSNVGVLLEGFRNQGMKVIGVDPAANICEIAEKKGIPTICGFFGQKIVGEIIQKYKRASVITGSNVFAHIDNWDQLTLDVKELLTDDGVFIIESPHFLHLVNSLEYDTIYHEHLSYILIEPLITFFDKYKMEIIRIENKDIHGGSVRIFVANKGKYPVEKNVNDIVIKEQASKLKDKEILKEFAYRVEENRQNLINLLREIKGQGKRIAAVSAPAKGMTLLNYCKIGKETLDYITEKSKLKIGLFSPGDNLPIFPDNKLLEDMPDYVLLLAWNFAAEIIENLKEYKSKGGKFIIPIPKPVII